MIYHIHYINIINLLYCNIVIAIKIIFKNIKKILFCSCCKAELLAYWFICLLPCIKIRRHYLCFTCLLNKINQESYQNSIERDIKIICFLRYDLKRLLEYISFLKEETQNISFIQRQNKFNIETLFLNQAANPQGGNIYENPNIPQETKLHLEVFQQVYDFDVISKFLWEEINRKFNPSKDNIYPLQEADILHPEYDNIDLNEVIEDSGRFSPIHEIDYLPRDMDDVLFNAKFQNFRDETRINYLKENLLDYPQDSYRYLK